MKYFSHSHNRGQYLRPPDLYEYFVDNYWFKSIDLENQKINEPLRGSHHADVVIVGGGFTGLSAAYHIRQKFPEKHIVLLEGACCGYGASGRNGGFCIATDLLNKDGDVDPETRRKNLGVSFYGLRFIKRMISEYGVECDLQENGMLEAALNEKFSRRDIYEFPNEDVKNLKVEDLHELGKVVEVRFILDGAEMTARSALKRQETRWGKSDFQSDFPERDDKNWLKFV
jgi:hypothetical protein